MTSLNPIDKVFFWVGVIGFALGTIFMFITAAMYWCHLEGLK